MEIQVSYSLIITSKEYQKNISQIVYIELYMFFFDDTICILHGSYLQNTVLKFLKIR